LEQFLVTLELEKYSCRDELPVHNLLGRLKPGAVYLVAGRPGVGKTAYLANACRTFWNQGHPALIILCGGQTGGPLCQGFGIRLLAMETGIPIRELLDVLQGRIEVDDGYDVRKFYALEGMMEGAGVQVVGSRSIKGIIKEIENWGKHAGGGVILLDDLYFGSDSAEIKDINSRFSEILNAIQAVKAPCIMTHMLDRTYEKERRYGPKPAHLKRMKSSTALAFEAIMYLEQYGQNVDKLIVNVQDGNSTQLIAFLHKFDQETHKITIDKEEASVN